MRLIDRLRPAPSGSPDRSRGAFGPYAWPNVSFNGIGYGPHELIQTLGGGTVESIEGNFGGYLRAVKQSPPAFGAQLVRSLLLSQAGFQFRNRQTRKMFGGSSLTLIEQPWPSGTTGELLSKMEWHEGLAGNAYVWRRTTRHGTELKVLRPDWVTILLGSEQDADSAANQLDAELVGYVYHAGGVGSGGKTTTLLPSEVAHWSPLPDPEASYRGMSWITPAVREIQGDIATADHKLKFFENGATPNLVVSGIPAANSDEFRELVDMMEESHAGLRNAYKTLYLAAGADATVVGADLKQVDFKATQGTGETRISVLSRVPAPILGISEGLAGSSLNAGNYGQARRNLSDGWLFPTLRSAGAALAPLVDTPSDSELWPTTDDMPFVREDAKDAAEIESVKATTIRTLVDGGFTAESAVAAVQAQDMSLLEHTGLASVQLLPPGTTGDPDAA